MPNCIVVVQFDLPKRSEELAVKGGTSTALNCWQEIEVYALPAK